MDNLMTFMIYFLVTFLFVVVIGGAFILSAAVKNQQNAKPPESDNPKVKTWSNTPAAATADDAIEREIARRRASAVAAAGYCANCGNPLKSGDRFCIRCGTAAPAEASA